MKPLTGALLACKHVLDMRNTTDNENAARVAEQTMEYGINTIKVPNRPLRPEYIAQNGEVELFRCSLLAGENILLAGPTGCGKTHLVEWMAQETGREVVTVQGGDGMTPEHLIGYRDIVKNNGTSVTVWRDGLLTKAMREGSLLYVDEPNALPEGLRFYLFSAMDERRSVTLCENQGEVVQAAQGFQVVGAMNEGAGYSGTSLLNYAFRARFGVIIDLDYLPKARETELISKRTGIAKTTAKQLAEIGASLRASHQRKEIKTPIGTRSLLACARLIKAGLGKMESAAITISAQVPSSFGPERKALDDVVAAYFAKQTGETTDPIEDKAVL